MEHRLFTDPLFFSLEIVEGPYENINRGGFYDPKCKGERKKTVLKAKWNNLHPISVSLRASSLGLSDGEAGKERRDCNYVCGI